MTKSSTAVIREDRLGSITGYCGTSNDLASQSRLKCLQNADRSFTQAFQCQQMTTILTLLTIRESALIIHAPVGCTGCALAINTSFRRGQTLRGIANPVNARWVSTNLDEADIIHGGEKKLREAILSLEERYSPKVIFIATSCASAIIGDDVDNVVNQTQLEVKGKIVPIHCEGFRTKISATGYDSSYNAILEYFLEPSDVKEDDLVNVLSPISSNKLDNNEIERLINAIGLKANFVPCFSSIDDLKRITAAKASTSSCIVHGDYFMNVLDKEYGIPHTKSVMPLGIENTDKWLLELAEITDKTEEAKAFIEEEHKKIDPVLEKLRSQLKDLRAFVSGGPARAVTIASLAKELGFKIIGVHSYTFDELTEENVDALAENQEDFVFNVANMQPFEHANIINQLKPDIFIGNGTWVPKQGIPTVQVLDQLKNSLGYKGVIETGIKIVEALQNPGFNIKLSKHKKLPYRSSWYQESPIKYLKTSEVD